MKKRILCLLMSAALFIPAYPGGKKMLERDFKQNGINIKRVQYQSTDSAEKIIDFYTAEFTKRGWVVFVKNPGVAPSVIFRYIDGSTLTVNCVDVFKRGINDIVITYSGPLSQETVDAMAKGTDMPGKELISVPRYPGAKRRSYSESGKYTQISYEVEGAQLDQVVYFYRNDMVARGWELKDEKTTTPASQFSSDKYSSLPLPEELKSKLKSGLKSLSQNKSPNVTLLFRNKNDKALIGISGTDKTTAIIVTFISGK